jgi:hypothetical protein
MRKKQMATIDKYGSGFELPPEGKHAATLIRFVDLGEQPGKFGSQRQADLAFEIAGEITAEGRPLLAFMRVFNLSARSKKFRETIQALTNLRDIARVDTRSLLGLSCTLDITHVTSDDGKTFANLEVLPLRGDKPPVPVSDTSISRCTPTTSARAILRKSRNACAKRSWRRQRTRN